MHMNPNGIVWQQYGKDDIATPWLIFRGECGLPPGSGAPLKLRSLSGGCPQHRHSVAPRLTSPPTYFCLLPLLSTTIPSTSPTQLLPGNRGDHLDDLSLIICLNLNKSIDGRISEFNRVHIRVGVYNDVVDIVVSGLPF